MGAGNQQISLIEMGKVGTFPREVGEIATSVKEMRDLGPVPPP